VGADPARYFHVMALLRGLRRLDAGAFKYLVMGRQQLQKDIASHVDQLLVSGPSEATEIRHGFPELASLPTWDVPHPVDLSDLPAFELPAEASTFRAGRQFLVAGRIESRKNQLSVLEVADQFPNDKFVFAGLVNETDGRYAQAFKQLLARRSNCQWVGQLSWAQLLQAIAQADAVLSPSWFEVMSLINLFAHALGTPIIAAAHTYDTDLLGEGVARYLPEQDGDLHRALNSFPTTRREALSTTDMAARAAAFTAATWQGFDAWLRQIENGKETAA
jgi:glycosyltransferase involved in cell wall biosynthesis